MPNIRSLRLAATSSSDSTNIVPFQERRIASAADLRAAGDNASGAAGLVVTGIDLRPSPHLLLTLILRDFYSHCRPNNLSVRTR